MPKIKKIADISFNQNEIIRFDASIISVDADGDAEKKRPFKFTVKLEDSGELLHVSSWKFDALDTVKEAINTIDVYELTGQAGVFGNYGNQVRIGSIEYAGKQSKIKELTAVDTNTIKTEIREIIKTYVSPEKYPMLNMMLTKLILENEHFWKWPAATKIHHAYPGGLATHSMNVCKNSINIWNTYKGQNGDIGMLVAGSLLHDIGKLSEYEENGARTKYGNFIPHPVIGCLMVDRAAIELNIDPTRDLQVLKLEHIILSHHEKLEFGAPVTPYIIEAIIIAKADALDAAYESASEALDTLSNLEESERLPGLNGNKIFKCK